MAKCEHTIKEQVAVRLIDGLCPLCLKAKELLKKAKESVKKDIQQSKYYGDRFGVCLNTYESAINEVLSLLDEPVCKTCGGSGEVVRRELHTMSDHLGGTEHLPCPDCQQQPPAGKFTTKELVESLRSIAEAELQMAFAGMPIKAVQKVLRQSADRLDQSEADLRQIINHQEVKIEALQKRGPLMNKQLEEKLAKRGEAIKYLARNVWKTWEPFTPPEEVDKELKRILGDENFERIVK